MGSNHMSGLDKIIQDIKAQTDAKIDELMKNRSVPTTAQLQARNCPECGKKVKPSPVDPLMGTCLFCGAKVPFNPSF